MSDTWACLILTDPCHKRRSVINETAREYKRRLTPGLIFMLCQSQNINFNVESSGKNKLEESYSKIFQNMGRVRNVLFFTLFTH